MHERCIDDARFPMLRSNRPAATDHGLCLWPKAGPANARPRRGARTDRAAPRRDPARRRPAPAPHRRSEEHTSELQSLMRISYAVFCLKKKKNKEKKTNVAYSQIIEYTT